MLLGLGVGLGTDGTARKIDNDNFCLSEKAKFFEEKDTFQFRVLGSDFVIYFLFFFILIFLYNKKG